MGGVSDSTKSLTLLPTGPTTPRGLNPADAVHVHFLAVRKRHIPRARDVGLSQKDRDQLCAALRRGFSVADLKLAVEGMFLSPYHLGQNDRLTKYLEFTYVLRNIEKFIELAETDAVRNAPGFLDGMKLLRLPNRDEFIPKAGEVPDMTGLFVRPE